MSLPSTVTTQSLCAAKCLPSHSALCTRDAPSTFTRETVISSSSAIGIVHASSYSANTAPSVLRATPSVNMHVYMNVCMHSCYMLVCVHACMYVCMFLCITCVNTRACMYVCMYVCIEYTANTTPSVLRATPSVLYLNVWMCVCIYVCVHVLCVCMYVCMYVCITRMYLVCIYVCVYMYVHECTEYSANTTPSVLTVTSSASLYECMDACISVRLYVCMYLVCAHGWMYVWEYVCPYV